MDDKPNVIKMIDYAIMIEENAIVFYAEGIEKELQWSNFDSEKKKVVGSMIVPNNAQHGGGGCVAVDEILKHAVTHVIAGGMGMGAVMKLNAGGIKVYRSTLATVKDVVEESEKGKIFLIMEDYSLLKQKFPTFLAYLML